MALWAWLDLEPTDIAAFIASEFLGALLGMLFLPHISLFILVATLTSYHLFLAWLVITAKRESGLSYSIVSTIMTHLACIVLVYALCRGVLLLSMFRGFTPMAELARPLRWILNMCIPGMAVFERSWLFGGDRVVATPVAGPSLIATTLTDSVDDYQVWLKLLAEGKRPPSKHGLTLKDEYENWLAARIKARAAASSISPSA